ncbi:MAG TPA: DUF4340 domain-containing protein [Burkholderiales bacterium]|nr:DUF4340 domain-containing protein [Burkholderiales bacterium]
MRRSMWLNALLAAAVAVLGAWAYFKSPRDAPSGHALSALKPSEAASIHIERPGAAPISLEKKAGAWVMTAPFAARGDESRVQRLLEILEAKSAHRLAATDLSRFELDPPQARVTIGRQAFSFGMVNAVTREQYLLTNGTVFALHPNYGTALPAHPGEMASPRLLGSTEKPVRIELIAFTVEQRNGKWTQMPAAKDPSQDDFLRWVELWQLSPAARVEPYVKGKLLEAIRIQLKDGATLALGVLAREPELVLLRADEKLQYHFRAELAKRLLSPPGTAVKEK